MKMIKFKLAAISAVLMMTLMYSCDYEYIEPAVIDIPDQEISFTDDIIPIFNASCNTSGCHVKGFFIDLSEENAYATLFAKNLVDLENPSNSKLYTKLIESGSHDDKATAEQKAYILKWLEEGAKDN